MTATMASPLSHHASEHPRKSYAKLPEILGVPSLIRIQLDSYEWFKREGLKELFEEVSPIEDIAGGRFELHFENFEFREPKYSETECRTKDLTYASPLYAKVRLVIKQTGEIKEQDLFMGDVPIMTSQGTFIINGAERVVVSQLVRSPGGYFTREEDPASGRQLCFAKLIPNRGAWLEFETSNKNVIYTKVDRKRKIPATTLLRCVGMSAEEIYELFKDVDLDGEQSYSQSTLQRDASIESPEEALIELYRRLRPGEPPTRENAESLLTALFFNPRRYDLGKVGRYKVNKRLGADLMRLSGLTSKEIEKVYPALLQGVPTKESLDSLLTPEKAERLHNILANRALNKEDLVAIIRRVILVNKGEAEVDDIDHLGNRRVKGVGELVQNQFRIGLLRMERVVRERMTLIEPETAVPSALVNIRPIVASIKEFFGGSQLSQFMDQTNPLAELTHKRRLSALGPGGLSRERAGFDVRDVHPSHYGRICPIETPEGPNIGLLGSLATYARVNEYGFIETPYRRVVKELPNKSEELIGRTLRENVIDEKSDKILMEAGTVVDEKAFSKLKAFSKRSVKIKPFVSDEIIYLAADEEDKYVIAQANSLLDDKNEFVDPQLEARFGERFRLEMPHNINFMDVSPKQIVSVSTSLIPFLEHDDANRALMGSNMQRQAVPLVKSESPLIGTGMEVQVARDSGQVCVCRVHGEVKAVTAQRIVIEDDQGEEHTYPLLKFVRSNQGTCINQRPIVRKGDVVNPGQVLADSSSTDHGELALGQNVLCAFMSWEGYNYEDAIVISERVVKQDKFTSIHIEKHEVEARDTKLGAEEITRDIPNVGEESLKDLDENGIIRIGAEVDPGDILVGKITPKGETELTAEEKLLRAIFGEKAREVKDTCLRVPHGEQGKVIEVKIFSRDNGDELPPGVNHLVRVWVAQTRKIAEGDKMAGRHGNKGVVSVILPEEDMPMLPDGTPVDIILNPIGVPSRMNLGQILETHLGLAANALGFKVMSPVFDGATDKSIEDALSRVWMAERAGTLDYSPDNGHMPGKEDIVRDWINKKGYNADQVFSETHQGYARQVCARLWLEEQGMDPAGAADGALDELLTQAMKERQTIPPFFGKTILRDGRTGEPFDQPITVGPIYMMKLIHLVEDKIHARSTGPYSLITQQPLGGKAQFGGQRFGEMEVWALEAYSAAYNLQEILTVKSDDVAGRVKTYEAIVKGEDVFQPGVPESFRVLQKELQSLGLSIELLSEEEEEMEQEPEEEDMLPSPVDLELTEAEGEVSDTQEASQELGGFEEESRTSDIEQGED